MYSTAKTRPRNSLVQFYPRGDRTLSPIPASIKHIYRDKKKTYLAVQWSIPADNLLLDLRYRTLSRISYDSRKVTSIM